MSADTTTSRSPLILVGVVIGVLALLAALWFLVISPLFLADDDPAAGPDIVPGQAAQGAADEPTEPAEPADEATEVDDEIPIATYEIFLSRDPFEPVIAPATTGGGTNGDGDGTDGGGTDGGGTDGGNGGTDGGNGGTDGGNGGTDDPCLDESAVNETVCDDIVVEITTVDEDAQGPFVVIELTPQGGSTTTYGPLRVGDRFGPQDILGQGQFRVLDIFVGSGCARLSFVDDDFQICLGDRVLK